ncbi:unnamed protein product [Cuscuta europaea]|uniref:RING-type E3 ubiquitin transferase n=1 Tax=Cuscuta europaea TaxID=41803 RepID=A0A9P0YS60_CUSEU|nr:unnamed protein product [Cuscuta europaea]
MPEAESKEELQSAVTEAEPKEELQRAVTEAESKEEVKRTVTIVESKEELQRAVTEVELKAELQRAVKEIISSIDINAAAIDRAERALRSLRSLIEKKRRSSVAEQSASSAPDEFRCYLSKKIMKHPVLIANGQTYEKAFIQEWFKSGKKTCPRTQQELSHTNLIPNLLVQEMISDWCKSNGIHLQDKVEQQGMTEADRNNLRSLLQRISSGLSSQRDAAKELRMLTRSMHPFRALFGESENLIPQLLSPLCETIIQEELQEDIITTLFNISLHDDNKKLIAETPKVIPLLIEALGSGTIATRSNAAATIFNLSALDSNKTLIGKAGALKSLICLLENGYPLAIQDAASAIFRLCTLQENNMMAVRDGAVGVVMEKIVNKVIVGELLSVLALLSTSQKAVYEMIELGAVSLLLGLIRETPSAVNKENCVVVLYAIFFSDRSKWEEMREAESRHGTLSQLAESGTKRAKRKASGILDQLNKPSNTTHTA